MKDNKQKWMAGLKERRLALLLSIVCMTLIGLALLWPYVASKQDVKVSASKPASYGMPAKPKVNQKAAPKKPLKPKAKQMPRVIPKKKTVEKKAVMPAPGFAAYYVQVGSFRDAGRARNLAAKLRRSGWHVQLADRPGGMHAVRVGPWKTQTEAEKAKKSLQKNNNLQGFVVKGVR